MADAEDHELRKPHWRDADQADQATVEDAILRHLVVTSVPLGSPRATLESPKRARRSSGTRGTCRAVRNPTCSPPLPPARARPLSQPHMFPAVASGPCQT